jgi:hypothetical protein
VLLLTSLVLFSGSQCKIEAQATAVAQVSGTVTDATGAAIVNAEVTMTETSKNLVRTVATDTSGRYTLPNLPVGPYRLEVKSQGFKNYVQDNIQLVVNNNIEINVPMQVGAASERVEVSAMASMVETKETSVSSVIDQKRIAELPLNGRQATQLIITLGGAAYGDAGDTGSKTFYSSTRISVAGGQSNGTAYLLDGGENTDAMSNVNLPFPFPDALQEFSIETSAVSSRFGTHPGATVNVVTKSGANDFHGDLFEYLRNGNVNARNFFSTGRDSLKRNQFGGTLGGRILRDKLFFFTGYQGTRNRSNPPLTTTFIPNASMLGGDFTTVASSACQSSAKTLTSPFAGNRIPTSQLNPVAVNFANNYLPVSSADQCGKVTYAIPVTGDEDQVIGRIDWIQNSKHSIFGRYFIVDFQNPATYDGKNILTTTQAGNLERAQSMTVGDTYAFGPTTLNSLHLTFTRRRDDRGPTDKVINPTMLGINMYSAVPNFLLFALTGGFSTFCGTCAPGHFNVTAYQVADDLDVIRGKHQMAFGFNIQRVFNNTVSGFNENGNFQFNGSRTGLSLADFLTGLPNDFQQTNATPDDLRTWIMSFYAQDTFKVNSRFTFNYGIRWEPTFANPDKYLRGSSFSLPAMLAGQVSKVYPNAPAGLFFPGDVGIPFANWNAAKANFAPRAGIVWNPHGDGRDTLRIGAGILYDVAETWFNERETTNAPVGTAIDILNPVGGLTNPWQGYPGGSPFPNNGRAYFPATGGVYVNMPLNPKPTYVANWNVTYQRQFAGNWMASISYLGNKTTHLWSSNGEMNPAMFLGFGPCTINGTSYSTCSTTGNTAQRRLFSLLNPVTGASYGRVNTADDGAVARYNGMIVSLEHRFAHNFTFLTNYTNSYCISDSDFGAALADAGNSQRFNRHADWGPCVFDTRHNFNASFVATSSLKTTKPWVNRLLSDWQIAPLVHASSGQPLNVTLGKDNSLSGAAGNGNDRPNQLLENVSATNPVCNNGTTACVQWLNSAAFGPSPLGTYGNLGRNAVRGPHTVTFDAAISRMFRMTERYSLQARVDAFNVLNHTNLVGAISPAGTVTGYTTLDTNWSSSTFGRSRAAFDPRILQFSMKFIF